MFSLQEIGSSFASLEIIFGALQSDLFWFKFDSLGSKILKFPEFKLDIWLARAQNVYPVTHCDVD